MMKSLKAMLKQDKEKYTVPKSVHDYIPITAIWEDGIFKVGNKFAKTFRFTDINYLVAGKEDKETMFLCYSELLNSLDSGATTKLTINNRRINKVNFEKEILIPKTGDELDCYREEYNNILLDKASNANGIIQEKYLTVSVVKKDIEEARTYFSRIASDLRAHFSALGSKCEELDATEKLRLLHDFYRAGEEESFRFDLSDMMKKGHSFKDYICPDSMERADDYIKLGEKYVRVLFLKDYASYIKDSMVSELTELNRNMMFSIDIVPIPMDEAVREVENRLLGVETNITNWQRKQNQNNNFSAVVPYDMELQRKESKEFLNDLTTRDQRMMCATVTMAHMADSKEQLDADTETILSTARRHLCQLAVLKFQQTDGLNTVLPIGCKKIQATRTLTTESLAVFMPFKVQEVAHEHGIYYGQNAISNNMIIANRKCLLNGNSFILGVSGSGKSFTGKCEIANLMLAGDSDIIIIDPEREYAPLVKAMGGAIIDISATSKNHINAMDMNSDYGDGEDPLILKSEFILSLDVTSGKIKPKNEDVYAIAKAPAEERRQLAENLYKEPTPEEKARNKNKRDLMKAIRMCDATHIPSDTNKITPQDMLMTFESEIEKVISSMDFCLDYFPELLTLPEYVVQVKEIIQPLKDYIKNLEENRYAATL